MPFSKSEAAVAGERRAGGRYAKTREYRSAISVKAAKTRRRNEAAADGGAPTPSKKSPSRRSAKSKNEPVVTAAASLLPEKPSRPG
jgi:hypothetical protein